MAAHYYEVDAEDDEMRDCNNCGAPYNDLDIEPGVRNRDGLCPGCLFMQDEDI